MTDSEAIKVIISRLELALKQKVYGSFNITLVGGKIVAIETKRTEKIGVSY